mmetsp:Transcript_12765/g.44718  ORF Transcript_12765/g.44718 Transcript_12765/m.44718 type:complete len:344 (-) Transcript_12765:148-1179(-)
MAASMPDKLTFKVEWVDPHASLKRYYLLQYYLAPTGNQLELFDIKNHRVFLRKCPYPSVALDDLFIGGKVTIYARQMTIVDYGDLVTQRAVAPVAARTFGLIEASGVSSAGKIIQAINAEGLTVAKLKMVDLSATDARAVGAAPGYAVGLEVVGPDAHAKWAEVAGAVPGCIAAPNAEAGEAAIDKFFGPDGLESAKSNTARVRDCTLCIIKPHIVLRKRLGEVLDAVQNSGLAVTAMQMFDIDMTASEEFLEVYKGVVPEYHSDCEELAGGRFLVIELSGENAVNRFREVAGPHDVEMARKIRPESLRARFGESRIKNAVHATDLDEDGELESEYFFRILSA